VPVSFGASISACPWCHPIDAALPAYWSNRFTCRLLEISPFTNVHWTANPGPVKIKGRSMRLAPVVLAALILAASFVATSVLSVSAVEFGTRAEAMAMVRRVPEKVEKDRPDAASKGNDHQ